MVKEPLFLKPVLQERIWGGQQLQEQFGYQIPSDHTGECWGISAHSHGPSVVKNGTLKGRTLADLWQTEPALFDHPKEDKFPLLVKILDAKADLSVQVHPDDAYAAEHEQGERGKTECWYVIDCQPGAQLIYGHHAKTRSQLEEMMEDGHWDDLLREVPIQPGDFFYIPSGTLHAIPAGTLILETQQNSDTTYRVYDYDRTDDQGRRRDLHLDQAVAVTEVPHQDADPQAQNPYSIEDAAIKPLTNNEFFNVSQWQIEGRASYSGLTGYYLVSVLEGQGTLYIADQAYTFTKGDHFIIPATVDEWFVTGHASGIFSYPS